MNQPSKPGLSRPELIAALRGIAERLSAAAAHPDEAICAGMDAILADIEHLCHPRNEQPQPADLDGFAEQVRAICGKQSIVISMAKDSTSSPFYCNASDPITFQSIGSGLGKTVDEAIAGLRKSYKPAPTLAEKIAKAEAELTKLKAEGGE